jgi:hypothetical protein
MENKLTADVETIFRTGNRAIRNEQTPYTANLFRLNLYVRNNIKTTELIPNTICQFKYPSGYLTIMLCRLKGRRIIFRFEAMR